MGIKRKQVTRGHNIVVDGWAGAANPHPYPTPHLNPFPTLTHTQKASKTLVFPLFDSCWRMDQWTDQCTLLQICNYGRRKAKSRSSPKSLYHSLLANVHLLYMSQPYFDKKNYYFTRGLNQKWTSQIIPKKIKKSNSIFDGNFFSTRINQVRHQRFFQDVLCLNW